MIPPTVGRVVWYYPPGRLPPAQPQAAIIAHVWNDRSVNLAIFDDLGRPITDPPNSVTLVQEGDVIPASGAYCSWMPYQLGQAAKTEAAEAAARAS